MFIYPLVAANIIKAYFVKQALVLVNDIMKFLVTKDSAKYGGTGEMVQRLGKH